MAGCAARRRFNDVERLAIQQALRIGLFARSNRAIRPKERERTCNLAALAVQVYDGLAT